jgi:molecular chaperone HscB
VRLRFVVLGLKTLLMDHQDAVLAAPAGVDHFAVFGLPRKLALDVKALERSFYRLSREVHPDRFATASPEKQQWSLEQTSLLNDAYRTLKQPIVRTEYLLRLEGVELADEKTPAKVPAELLEEVFELNMQLEEMRAARRMGGDDPDLRRDLTAAQAQFTAQLTGIDAEIERNWALWDGGVEAEQAVAKKSLAALLDKRRYVRNLVRDVNQALA